MKAVFIPTGVTRLPRVGEYYFCRYCQVVEQCVATCTCIGTCACPAGEIYERVLVKGDAEN